MVARVVIVTVGVAGSLALLAIYGKQMYGLTLFILVPFLIGFIPATLLADGPPRRFRWVLKVVSWIGIILGAIFIVLAIEGLLCLILTMPLLLPVAVLGAAIAYLLFSVWMAKRGKTTVLLLVALTATAISLEEPPTSPVYEVSDSIVINATPSETWNAIVAMNDVRPSGDWLFRAGAACPQKTKIVEAREGGRRVCTLSTGVLMEEIDAWEPMHRLSWRALSTPPPMKELNPFGDVDAPHLHGFYRNVRGEFVLEPAGPGKTRVTRRTWYEHDLSPNAYWRIWCDMGASKIHRFVLEELRVQIEGDRA